MARKDPLDKLNLRHAVAVANFLDAAVELEEVAEELTGHALAADQAATRQAERAAAARTQAQDAKRRAARIRELID